MRTGEIWELQNFQVGTITIAYPKAYFPFIRECLVYDVYRSDLIKNGDTVIDLGAAVGEFTIQASKRVGSNGVVIAVEPNPTDFKILERNMRRNNCSNVVLVNKGVGSMNIEREISFWGRNFLAHIDTLRNIMQEVGVTRDANFVKMDIEGCEIDVARTDIDILKKANVISVELHNTRYEIDTILKPYGFEFIPLSSRYCIKKLVRNTLLSNPGYLMKVIMNSIRRDPKVLYKILLRYEVIEDPSKPYLVTGSYIRRHNSFVRSTNETFRDP